MLLFIVTNLKIHIVITVAPLYFHHPWCMARILVPFGLLSTVLVAQLYLKYPSMLMSMSNHCRWLEEEYQARNGFSQYCCLQFGAMEGLLVLFTWVTIDSWLYYLASWPPQSLWNQQTLSCSVLCHEVMWQHLLMSWPARRRRCCQSFRNRCSLLKTMSTYWWTFLSVPVSPYLLFDPCLADVWPQRTQSSKTAWDPRHWLEGKQETPNPHVSNRM